MTQVTLKHEGNEYLIDKDTLEKCKVVPKPTYDRMEVLRGEWIPPVGCEVYWLIVNGTASVYRWARNTESTSWYFPFDSSRERHSFPEAHAKGERFFPTRELAEEYIAKHKPVRPLVGTDVTIDGVTYKLS